MDVLQSSRTHHYCIIYTGVNKLLRARRHVGQHAIRQDRTGADVVDEDAVAPDLVGQALGERHHAHAGGAREHEIGDGLVHGARQDVDDAAAALPLHVGNRFARHPREEEQGPLHGCCPLLLRGP